MLLSCPLHSKGSPVNISFENKVALVTGAGSGLGIATATAFAESGAAVVLADWNEKSVRDAADELVGRGFKALAVRCDVSDDSHVEVMVAKTVATFGSLDGPTTMLVFRICWRKPPTRLVTTTTA
jgi:NAD(P)-dependent dehydrogenase (short-subunit alcohol dehydrogenase family)